MNISETIKQIHDCKQPLNGEVPTYIQIDLKVAKKLAEPHRLKEDMDQIRSANEQMVIEMKKMREALHDFMRKMPQK